MIREDEGKHCGSDLRDEGGVRAGMSPKRKGSTKTFSATGSLRGNEDDEEAYSDEFEEVFGESKEGHVDGTCDQRWEDVSMKDIDLGQEIGGGGFAIVYQGVWKRKRVALKTLVCILCLSF